ncbi:helix-turn-helix domain-containing protein [Ligilactobacillus sp. LYQ135]
MTIFDRIKKLAKEHSKTLRQVTDDLELSQNYIYNLKQSGKQPNATTLEKFADYFQVSVDYLLGREDKEPDTDIERILDNAMSYDGKPLTEHDRKALKGIIKAYLDSKD